MGKSATMILWDSVKLGICLVVFVFFFQTGYFYLTTIFAEFQPNIMYQDQLAQHPFVLSYKSELSSETNLIKGGARDMVDSPLKNKAVIVQEYLWFSSSGEVAHAAEDSGYYGESEDGARELARPQHEVSSESDELQNLEKKLLSLFVIPSGRAKKRTRKRSVSRQILELFKKQRNTHFLTMTDDWFPPGKRTQHANTVRIFNPIEILKMDTELRLHTIFQFDVSSIPPNEKVSGAELRVPFSLSMSGKNMTPEDEPIFARVLAHDLIRPVKKFSKKSARAAQINGNNIISYPTDSKLTNLTNRKSPVFWLTFDVLPAVLRWFSEGHERNKTKLGGSSHNIALEILGRNGERDERIKVFDMKVQTDAPTTLFVYTDDGQNAKIRTKRNANKILSRRHRTARQHLHYYHHNPQHYYHAKRRKPHRHKNRRRNLCSRKPMFVDFTDVGWNNWIAAPSGYQAFYCSGECPFPMAEHLNATNHAVIQALINSMNPALVPPPCCVPNKYSSLSLLYTDSSDRIVLKNYNEMIVDSCGCS